MTTPTLMTAAEMRAHLIEKRAKEAAEAAQIAEQEAELAKAWAVGVFADRLEELKCGAASTYAQGTREECDALLALAESLGYVAGSFIERDDYHVVIEAPKLEEAMEKPRTEPGDEDWLNGATGRVK